MIPNNYVSIMVIYHLLINSGKYKSNIQHSMVDLHKENSYLLKNGKQ